MAKNSKVTEVCLIAGEVTFERDYKKDAIYHPSKKHQRILLDVVMNLPIGDQSYFKFIPGGWIYRPLDMRLQRADD